MLRQLRARLNHGTIERNLILLGVLTLITVSIGGLVQVIPLFTVESTIERVDGVRPYSPLELAGRDIYVREGCYTCHSQMIRPFRDEAERYGHYSLAAESMYDHPFQWCSKRTGPDLARVGGRYSDDWHVLHLADPRSVVPESIMPAYAFLNRPLDYSDIEERARPAPRRRALHGGDDPECPRRPGGAGQPGDRQHRHQRPLCPCTPGRLRW
jgi:cytochrome c oxidase cbb3-type subunit 2